MKPRRISFFNQLTENDLLFPYRKSIGNAKKHVKTLADVKVFENVGHGIETYPEAMRYAGKTIKAAMATE